MNTISPISAVRFSGVKQTAAKAVKAPKFMYRGSMPEPMYTQTHQMQELVSQIYKCFEANSKKAEEAIASLREKFPNFLIKLDKNPFVNGRNAELQTCREALYEKGKNGLHKVKDVDTYIVSGKDVYGRLNFRCTLTTPESGDALYSVPNIFNQKTKCNNTPNWRTAQKVEDNLKAVLESIKK